MIEQSAGRLMVRCPMRLANATALRDAGRAMIKPGEVVFDLSAVDEADSSALAVMLAWLRYADIVRSTVRFTGIPVGVLALANLYGVAELLPPA